MSAFRTCVEADKLMRKLHFQRADVHQQAVLQPALREAVGDVYPDATFTSLLYPVWDKHAELTFKIRFTRDMSILYVWDSRTLYYFWKDLYAEYDDRFKCARAAVDRFMQLSRSEEFNRTAFSWYWRKDWVAACVGV
jgi:hypothetical protein